jgi:hypothetical protein
MTDYFIAKGDKPTLAHLVTISERKDGNVHFANAWGGFVHYMPEAAFADRFKQLPEAKLNRLFRTYRPITVTAPEEDGSMEGFTNGQTWNGWEVPLFSKEAVLKALEENGHLVTPDIYENTRYFFDHTTDDLYEIAAEEGDIPDGFDVTTLEDFLAQPRDSDELYAFGKTTWDVRILRAHRTAIVVKGGNDPLVVYEVGSGWCWEDMKQFDNEPDDSDAPTPRA